MGQTSISTWLTSKPATTSSLPEALHVRCSAEAASGTVNTRSPPCAQPAVPEIGAGEAREGVAPRPRALPEQASLHPCSTQHLKAFRRLTTILLPIPYPDSFYRETVDDPVIAPLSRVVLWGATRGLNGQQQDSAQVGQLVAAIRCRLLAAPLDEASEQQAILYISTLGTLSPFRTYGLATYLLDEVIMEAAQRHGATAVMAHVWEANDEALAWYQKRGFRIVDKDTMYYRRLAPQTAAYVIRRDLRPSDLLQHLQPGG